jgi:multisubunit Na+/H+ antiporter MnhB subunit
MSKHKKPGVAFWATVALAVVLVAYPLSFGPACWLADKGVVSAIKIMRVYRPIVAWMMSPTMPLHSLISRYAIWCGGEEMVIVLMEMQAAGRGRL